MINEVRAVISLGLNEAKKLVEGTPVSKFVICASIFFVCMV